MNWMNEKIFEDLKARFGPEAWIRSLPLKYYNIRFFYRTKDLVENDRMGEVVFAVERPNGKFIAVRSSEYPKGIFRIPTGGIKHGEDIVEAVRREVSEELGLKADIVRFIGVYRMELTHGRDRVWFYSFFFHLKETGGVLLEEASDDEVSEVLEVDAEGLLKLAQNLQSIEKDWKDWGSFRYLTTKAIADYVRDRM